MGKGRGQLRAVQRMERWGKHVSDSTTGWTNRTKLGLGSLGTLAIGAGIGAYLHTRGATNETTKGPETRATNEPDGPGDTNMRLRGGHDNRKTTSGYRMVIPASKGSAANAAPLDPNQNEKLLALLNDDETSGIGSGTLRRLHDGGFEWNSGTTIRKPEVGRIILDAAGKIKVVDAPKEGEWGVATTITKQQALSNSELRQWKRNEQPGSSFSFTLL